MIKTPFGYHVVQLIERRGEQVRARHILMKIERGPDSDSTAVRRLRDLRQSIVDAKETFANLAKKYSDDEETKAQGGDLGSLTADQLVPEFAATVTPLAAGEISQPARASLGTTYGWHIVWLRKRTPAHSMNIEQDLDRIQQLALYMKRNRLNAEWVEELKKTIYLDVKL